MSNHKRNTGPAHAARRGAVQNECSPTLLAGLARAAESLDKWGPAIGQRSSALGDLTVRGLANDLGVSDKTVRRWLKGQNRPAPEHHAKLTTWIRKMDRAVKKLTA